MEDYCHLDFDVFWTFLDLGPLSHHCSSRCIFFHIYLWTKFHLFSRMNSRITGVLLKWKLHVSYYILSWVYLLLASIHLLPLAHAELVTFRGRPMDGSETIIFIESFISKLRFIKLICLFLNIHKSISIPYDEIQNVISMKWSIALKQYTTQGREC